MQLRDAISDGMALVEQDEGASTWPRGRLLVPMVDAVRHLWARVILRLEDVVSSCDSCFAWSAHPRLVIILETKSQALPIRSCVGHHP